jgi:hypothetical protein
MRVNRLMNLSLSIAVLLTPAVSADHRKTSQVTQLAFGNVIPFQECLSDSEVSMAVRSLSHGKYEDQQRAVARLKAEAGRSTTCRKQVITNMMSAMDQPNVDLTAGTPQFFLWHNGTRLLGELKATEALDLFIANLDRHDGSGFPFNHYPALGGVIDMGEIALPRLQTALRENPDRFKRRLTVFCIALIGGTSAHQMLMRALESETDPCVVSCIQASITAFNNKRRPHYISNEQRTTWYSTFLCNGE